jgi:hypothetical protein
MSIVEGTERGETEALYSRLGREGPAVSMKAVQGEDFKASLRIPGIGCRKSNVTKMLSREEKPAGPVSAVSPETVLESGYRFVHKPGGSEFRSKSRHITVPRIPALDPACPRPRIMNDHSRSR